MSRIGTVKRQTGETQIEVIINLDGSGKTDISTGIGFFDHMLNNFARHGLFDLTVKATGDLYVDCHHLVEDTGIVLGQAIAQAVGDKAGIAQVHMDTVFAFQFKIITQAYQLEAQLCLVIIMVVIRSRLHHFHGVQGLLQLGVHVLVLMPEGDFLQVVLGGFQPDSECSGGDGIAVILSGFMPDGGVIHKVLPPSLDVLHYSIRVSP